MTSLREATYGVWLGAARAGTLHQRGDYTWFEFDADYRDDPDRPVLGLQFESNLLKRHAAHLRLPPWFSNLLPEGRLREWIADERGVSVDREMELLAQVGHDLPGAVRVLAEDLTPGAAPVDEAKAPPSRLGAPEWRFSLAGVGLKFSMLRVGDRLTLPAHGAGGDWIVKLPDRLHADVPRNEFVSMRLAAAAGITVPDTRLVHRDELTDLPAHVWPGREEWAYAVRRFDRDDTRAPIHIEDLAQVRDFYPDDKYHGSYETVAALVHRRRDVTALREFARRLAFTVLIANGDAHLKNWSLIYRNPRVPTLAPAYDLVSTEQYRASGDPETLGLKFGRTKDPRRITPTMFGALQSRLGAPRADLPDLVAETVDRTVREWPELAETVADVPAVRHGLDQAIKLGRVTLTGGVG